MRKTNRKTVLLLSIAAGSVLAPGCGGATTGSGDEAVNVDDTDAGAGGAGGHPYLPGTGGAYAPGTGGAFPGGAGGTIAPGLVGVLPYPPGTGGASSGGAYPVGIGGMPVGTLPYPPTVDAGPPGDGGSAEQDARGRDEEEGEAEQSDGGAPEADPMDPPSAS